jgi:formylglycine-generating enzyme required for sulfatase activity
MPKIFISYRREDSEHITGRICDHLEARFGHENVFLDVNAIPFGVDFREHLDRAVGQCGVLLAVIGEQWLDVRHREGAKQGRRRLDDPADFVRIEIESALARGIPVVPVLVGRADMPGEEELPQGLLRKLAYRQAAEVRSGRDFRDHVDRLIRGIELLLQEGPGGPEEQPREEPARQQEEQQRPQEEEAAPRPRDPAQLQREGEAKLARLVREAMERTGGRPTAEDTVAFGEVVRQHRLPKAWAKAIIAEGRRLWEQERSRERRPGEVVAVVLGPGLEMAFAWIPPGTFLMGSPATEAGRASEETQHRVTLTRGFWLGIHPVTQTEWQAVMDDNPSQFREGNRPVEQVSWDDCQEFCRKLGARTGKRFRLPTEAEWEYACRAGTTTAYYTGAGLEALKRAGWCSYDGVWGSAGQTMPVGQLEPNAWGLADMHGNVWEWCADFYAPYETADATDPVNTSKGDARVLRGGAWCHDPKSCRAAARSRWEAGYRHFSIGCRVCLCPD